MGGSSWDYQWHSHNLHLQTCVCAYVNAWWCYSHNLHLETFVCLLMSMLEVEEWEDLLGTIKERRSSFLNRSSRSTEVSACS